MEWETLMYSADCRKLEGTRSMTEIEHFFDMEIIRAEDCVTKDWVECFNGVEVGSELAKKLNVSHVKFCKNAKKSLGRWINDMESKEAEMQSAIDCLKNELRAVKSENEKLLAENVKDTEINVDIFDIPIQKTFRLIIETQDIYQKYYGCSDGFDMALSDLRQIAEHLLIYCNSQEIK